MIIYEQINSETINNEKNGNEKEIYLAVSKWFKNSFATFSAILMVIFTGLLWYSTNKLAKSADDTAQRQLRAYIGIGSPIISIKNKDDKEGRIGISLSNAGQTPAYNVHTHINYMKNSPKDFKYIDYNPESDKNTSISTLDNKTPQTSTISIPSKDFQPNMYIYGHVDYTDIFKKKWHTNF